MNNIKILIYSLSSGVLFDGTDSAVFLPAEDGYFEIRNEHIPLCSTLAEGVVKFKGNYDGIKILSGSICMFFQNKLSIFTE